MVNWTLAGCQEEAIPSFPRHRVPHWEVLIYTSGQGESRVGNVPLPFRPGTIVCVPPNTWHQETGKKPFTCIVFHVRSLPRSTARPCLYQDSSDGDFLALARAMVRVTRARPPHWQRIRDHLVGAMEAWLDRWEGACVYGRADVEGFRNRLLAGHRAPGFSVGRAQRGWGVSPDHLRRCFARATGMTPTAYLAHVRMEAACLQLRTTDRPIGAVAEAVGFQNPFYFSRQFKKLIGVSPRAYRRQSAAPTKLADSMRRTR